MCGIFGIQYNSKNHSVDEINLRAKKMQSAAKYRGPDAQGFLHVDSTITGMTRLSIFDNSTYPIPLKSAQSILAFNGEIYDFNTNIQLDFTRSDTGALLQYLDMAQEIEQLNGMFGFARYDLQDRKLLLARDRSGEKPIYYYERPGLFLYGSDIKIILAGLVESEYPQLVNVEDVDFLEINCFEDTPFQGIKMVMPGTQLTVYKASVIENRSYTTAKTLEWQSVKDYEDEADFLLKDSVKMRTKNCIGTFGSFLSGGLDSSLITALSNPNFAVLGEYDVDGFSEGENVIKFASELGTPLHVVKPTKQDFERIFPKLPFLLDTPATWTAFNQFMVFEKVNELNCRVCMSGEGADELFGGYARYRLPFHLNRIYKDPVLNTSYHPMINGAFGSVKDLYIKLTNRSKIPIDRSSQISKFYSKVFSENQNLINAMGIIDFYTTMQVLLQMPDRVGLYHRVENRAPFLDPRLIAFSRSLPENYKINDDCSKVLMRKIAKRIIPKYESEVFKKGFGVPYNHWYGKGGYSRYSFNSEYKKIWKRDFSTYKGFTKRMNEFYNELV